MNIKESFEIWLVNFTLVTVEFQLVPLVNPPKKTNPHLYLIVDYGHKCVAQLSHKFHSVALCASVSKSFIPA